MEWIKVIVKSVKREAPDIRTIYFEPASGRPFGYEAGQYVTVYVPGGSAAEGKVYSLSSAPHEPRLSITVKRIGEYSGYLCGLKKGEEFCISPAYGFFNPRTDKPLVALVAGVGVSPALSVIKDDQFRGKDRPVQVYFSNPSHRYIPQAGELAATGADTFHHITREADVPAGMRKGRIVPAECLAVNDARYMICGSVSFVRDMWQGLTAGGVVPEHIVTEAFFES